MSPPLVIADRYDTEAALEDLNAALPAKVAVFDGFGLWYAPGADRATLDRTVAEAASRAWAGWVDEVVPVATLGDRGDVKAEAIRFSHRDGRSPDAVVFPKPGFIPDWYQGKGSTHGSIQGYDRHVPGILWGAGVKPERLDSPTAPYVRPRDGPGARDRVVIRRRGTAPDRSPR